MIEHQDLRYSKQIKVHNIGEVGQQLISQASCVIVGLGALGSTVADQLTRAGIGHLTLIDRDYVEWSNLHRQSLYDEQDATLFLPKAVAAQNKLRAINSSITIEGIIANLQPSNIATLLEGYDYIVDCSDNFTVRYLINDYCVAHNKTWIYGAVVGTSGSTTTITPGETPCFRCLFQSPPSLGAVDTCDTAGVISPIVTMIASLQTTEVFKLATNQHSELNRKLVQLDCWNGQWLAIDISQMKSTDCPCCGEQKFEWLHGQNLTTTQLCGRNTIQLTINSDLAYNLDELSSLLSTRYEVKRNLYLLKVRYNDDISVVFFPDQRVMIQGTDDEQFSLLIINKMLQI